MSESIPGPGYPRLDAGFFVQFGINRGAAQTYANGWNNAVAAVNTPVDPNSPVDKQIRQLHELGKAWGRIGYLQRREAGVPRRAVGAAQGGRAQVQVGSKGGRGGSCD